MGEVFMMGGTGGGVDVSDATTTTDKVLSGETFYSNENEGDSVLVGTMPNNGLLNPESLSAGDSYTVPKGYTDGGIITAKDLASQTSATATASSILSGETAWVNGLLINGTMVNNGAMNYEISAGGVQEIPEGYHNGLGVITATSLSSQTLGTAVADNIVSGKTAWVNGEKITGSMSNSTIKNNGTATSSNSFTLELGKSATISTGYIGSAKTISAPNVTRGARGNFIFTGGSKNTNSSGYGDFSITISFGFTPTYLAITFPQINGGSSVFNIFNMTVSNMGTAYSQETNGLKAQLVNVTNNGCTLRIYGFNENQVHASSGTAYYVAC